MVDLGIALTLVATFAWGAGDVFARRAMFDASPELVLVVVVGAVAAALGAAVFVGYGAPGFRAGGLEFFGFVMLTGLLAWVTGNLFYFHGLKRAGVTLAAPVLGAGPLFAIALAVTVGGERPNLETLAGAGAIVAGVGLILTRRDAVLG